MKIHFTPLYCTFHETTYSARNLLQKFFHCQWFLWKWTHAAPVVGVMYIASVFVSWYLKSVKTRLIICRHIENVAVGLVVFGDKGKCSISAVLLASVHYFSLHRCVPDKSPDKFSSFFFLSSVKRKMSACFCLYSLVNAAIEEAGFSNWKLK